MKTPVIQPNETKQTKTPSAADQPRPAPSQESQSSTSRTIGLIATAFVAVVGVVALAGGSVMLWANAANTDAGYFTAEAHEFSSSSHAIVANGLDANTGDLDFLLSSGRLQELRLTTTSADPENPVFVGIASQQDVAAYLRNVEQDEVRALDFDPFAVRYATLAGDAAPVPPADVPIWVAFSSGASETLEWEMADGDWSVVVMNADGSADVSADIAVAAKAPLLFHIGLGFVIGGAVLVLAAAIGFVFAVRSRRRFGPPSR
jgi:hypothetical protein